MRLAVTGSRTGRSPWPTLGFVCLVASIALTVAFFSWGFRQPDLDRIWTIHHQLKIGAISELAPKDQALLERNMRKYPALASALLGGREIGLVSAHNWQGWLEVPHATILRTPKSSDCNLLQLAIHTDAKLMPFQLKVQGAAWTERREVTTSGPLSINLPKPTSSELVLIRFEGQEFPADPSRIGVKLDVKCAEHKAAQP